MSGLGDVFGGLKAMSQFQLLFAFFACIAYALGQGGLVNARARRYAWGIAFLSAIGFSLESTEWMQATMLLAFAVAGMGLFVGAVWITSHMLGFRRDRPYAALDALQIENAASQRGAARGATSLHGDHAHSL
jgi:hypothetical protein